MVDRHSSRRERGVRGLTVALQAARLRERRRLRITLTRADGGVAKKTGRIVRAQVLLAGVVRVARAAGCRKVRGERAVTEVGESDRREFYF